MSNKRSFVWDFFTLVTPDKNKVKCNLCQTYLSAQNRSGTTSNLTRHIKLKHPRINISESRKRPHSFAVDDENEKRGKHTAEFEADPEIRGQEDGVSTSKGIVSVTPFKAKKQDGITSYLNKPLGISKQRNIDNQML